MRISLILLIVMAVVALASDWLILKDIRTYLSGARRSLAKWIWIASTALCWAALIFIVAYPKRSSEISIEPAMWVLYSWLSVYLPKILYCICSLIGRIFIKGPHKKPNRGVPVGIVMAVLCFVMMWTGVLITRHHIVVTKVDIESDKLPQSFDGLRVVQFSDAHVGTWGNDTTFISTLVDSINSLKPDLILFTGDIVNRQSKEIKPFLPVLSRLKAPLGVHMVFGNHDYSGYVDWPDGNAENADCALLADDIRSMGWNLYSNSHSFIKNGIDSIALIGVDNWGEPPFNRLGDLVKAYPSKDDSKHSLNDSTYKILLTHNPNHWVNVVRDQSNIDLTLSGHTHAMQAMAKVGGLRWSPAVLKYPNWGGLYSNTSPGKENMKLYVNIGSGEVGFPARIGAAYPEITLFTLHSKKGAH